MENTNVFKKLSNARAKLHTTTLTKKGKNDYYTYFRLEDFLADVIKICNEVGLTNTFVIDPPQFDQTTGMMIKPAMARLTIIDVDNPDQTVEFHSDVVRATVNGDKSSEIQELGATITYMRRYLWLMAMEIAENDIVDGEYNQKLAHEKSKQDKTNDLARQQVTAPTPVKENKIAVMKKYDLPDNAPSLEEALNHDFTNKNELIAGKKVVDFVKGIDITKTRQASKVLQSVARQEENVNDSLACKVVINALIDGKLTFEGK